MAQPDYTKIVIPPALQIKRSNSATAFLQNSGALYAEADDLAEKRRQELVEQKAEQDARREG